MSGIEKAMDAAPISVGSPVAGQSARRVTTAAAEARTGEQLDAVSASLRKAYSATVAEEVPDSLMDLLKQLR